MKINLKESEKQIIAIMIGLSLVSFFYVRQINKEIALGAAKDAELSAYEESLRPFLNLALVAKAFVIYDANDNNFVYKKNGEMTMPLASLAKVMSTIVVLENAPADKIFTISKESLDQAADHGLLVGEKWRRDDLLKFALFVSSNDAVHELALETGRLIDPTTTDPVKTFVDEMNSRSLELGFKTFKFNNESGLDVSESENGAYASAREMAKLFAYAVKTYPDIFAATKDKIATISSLDKSHNIDNTNTVVDKIPDIVASKTGFTALSGGNLVVATSPEAGEIRVVVVMGSTYDERFTDMEMLTSAVGRSTK